MIKKIILIILLSYVVISCGKKGDPKYKDPEQTKKIEKILINRV
tara:strand:- start:2278 stop:2409 length:132 start_codon:yes stop_codon:yes gene_type:complete